MNAPTFPVKTPSQFETSVLLCGVAVELDEAKHTFSPCHRDHDARRPGFCDPGGGHHRRCEETMNFKLSLNNSGAWKNIGEYQEKDAPYVLGACEILVQQAVGNWKMSFRTTDLTGKVTAHLDKGESGAAIWRQMQ